MNTREAHEGLVAALEAFTGLDPCACLDESCIYKQARAALAAWRQRVPLGEDAKPWNIISHAVHEEFHCLLAPRDRVARTVLAALDTHLFGAPTPAATTAGMGDSLNPQAGSAGVGSDLPPANASLPDADVWTWECHRCGYKVGSVEESEMRDLRGHHLMDEHDIVKRAAGCECHGEEGDSECPVHDEPATTAEAQLEPREPCKPWCGTRDWPDEIAHLVWFRSIYGETTIGFCSPACRDAGRALAPAGSAEGTGEQRVAVEYLHWYCERCLDPERCKRASGCVDAGEEKGDDYDLHYRGPLPPDENTPPPKRVRAAAVAEGQSEPTPTASAEGIKNPVASVSLTATSHHAPPPACPTCGGSGAKMVPDKAIGQRVSCCLACRGTGREAVR